MRIAPNLWRSAIAIAATLAFGSSCSMEPAPAFTVTGTGDLSGLLFLDRNHDGLFDPAAGDSALPNVHLQVITRGGTTVLAGADTRTDANGRFLISGLPAGTHSLQIDTTGISAKVSFCINPVPVSIYLASQTFTSVDGRGGCVILIHDAEAKALGTRVTVRGTVTSSLAQISTGTAYIEEASGGIQLFSPVGPSFAIGDVIEVSGNLAAFSNELELSSVTVNSVSAGTPLVPTDVTALQAVGAGGDSKADLQGRLVRIKAGKLL
ncbi:MAG: hypothetical protein ABUL71_02910, partial [Gemmatimonadota bacterium]